MKILLSLIGVLCSSVTSASIHKEALLCKDSEKMCFYWWPELPEVKGWAQDKNSSYYNEANTQVPIGYTFNNAEYVIYAKAIYKKDQPNTKNINEFIEQDKAMFLAESPGTKVKVAPPIKMVTELSLKASTFYPIKKETGKWLHTVKR